MSTDLLRYVSRNSDFAKPIITGNRTPSAPLSVCGGRVFMPRSFVLCSQSENSNSTKNMNIELKPELEQIIEAQIATGRYSNPEEVVSKALKLLLEWEQGYQKWVEETRQKVEVAIEQLDRGEGIDGEVVVESLRKKLRQAREAR